MIAQSISPATLASNKLAVAVDHLTVKLGALTVLSDFSLNIHEREQVAIIGPSGAGKTTLVRVLSTALRTQPEIALWGISPWLLSPNQRQRLRAKIGTIWQHAPLPESQRVMTAVLAGKLGQWGLLQSLKSLWRPVDIDGAHEALKKLGVEHKLSERCGDLSGGQLQRVSVARVLYQSPELILADEPVSALDPVLAEQTISVLMAHASATKATLIASLHAVDLALKYFPRVIGLRAGQVLFDCAPAAITPAMLSTLYAGDESGFTESGSRGIDSTERQFATTSLTSRSSRESSRD